MCLHLGVAYQRDFSLGVEGGKNCTRFEWLDLFNAKLSPKWFWRNTRSQEVGWGRVTFYLTLHCHCQNDSCIKMGSDESRFNVRGKVTKTV